MTTTAPFWDVAEEPLWTLDMAFSWIETRDFAQVRLFWREYTQSEHRAPPLHILDPEGPVSQESVLRLRHTLMRKIRAGKIRATFQVGPHGASIPFGRPELTESMEIFFASDGDSYIGNSKLPSRSWKWVRLDSADLLKEFPVREPSLPPPPSETQAEFRVNALEVPFTKGRKAARPTKINPTILVLEACYPDGFDGILNEELLRRVNKYFDSQGKPPSSRISLPTLKRAKAEASKRIHRTRLSSAQEPN